MQIAIFITKKTERLSYLLNFIFGDFFDIKYQLYTDSQQFINYSGPKICYNTEPLGNAVWINPHPLLFEKDIKKQKLELQQWKGEKAIFLSSNAPNAFTVDVFAQTFFFLTRYEEYLPFKPDSYGRFLGKSSFAYQHGIHHSALVDLWLLKLRDELMAKVPAFPIPIKTYPPLIPTIDIDHPWEIKYLPSLLQWAKVAKSLFNANWKKSIQLAKTILKLQKDAFDHYEIFVQTLKIFPEARFFFLMRNDLFPDQNRHLDHPAFQNKIKTIKKNFKIGIHPSLASHSNFEILNNEYKTFNNLSEVMATESRQHYLMLKLPDTYRKLLQLGIRHDFSMGFHDICGFRAGTSRPFQWFDLENDQATQLTIYPFQWMDVSLKNYLKLEPTEAKQLIKAIRKEALRHKGGTSFIWHNSSFDTNNGWNGWREVYEECLNLEMAE